MQQTKKTEAGGAEGRLAGRPRRDGCQGWSVGASCNPTRHSAAQPAVDISVRRGDLSSHDRSVLLYSNRGKDSHFLCTRAGPLSAVQPTRVATGDVTYLISDHSKG